MEYVRPSETSELIFYCLRILASLLGVILFFRNVGDRPSCYLRFAGCFGLLFYLEVEGITYIPKRQ
jgi:hypothetical protein